MVIDNNQVNEIFIENKKSEEPNNVISKETIEKIQETSATNIEQSLVTDEQINKIMNYFCKPKNLINFFCFIQSNPKTLLKIFYHLMIWYIFVNNRKTNLIVNG